MQDPREGVDRTITDYDVKDGLSYAPSCLWRGFVKMELPRRLDIVSAF
jgi:hypothetical protein